MSRADELVESALNDRSMGNSSLQYLSPFALAQLVAAVVYAIEDLAKATREAALLIPPDDPEPQP
jgi:hypothetical protein